MADMPANPSIYHITHVDNLASIVADGFLWSDAEMLRSGRIATSTAMSHIKRRRLDDLVVHCHPPAKVGEFVPFYFCPRSIMLYIICQRNHPDLQYRGGQETILHFRAAATVVARAAIAAGVRWATSDRSAAERTAEFSADTAGMAALNWQAIHANDWREPETKSRKQAEFLVERRFPWRLVEEIGVFDAGRKAEVEQILASTEYRPRVSVCREWYY